MAAEFSGLNILSVLYLQETWKVSPSYIRTPYTVVHSCILVCARVTQIWFLLQVRHQRHY